MTTICTHATCTQAMTAIYRQAMTTICTHATCTQAMTAIYRQAMTTICTLQAHSFSYSVMLSSAIRWPRGLSNKCVFNSMCVCASRVLVCVYGCKHECYHVRCVRPHASKATHAGRGNIQAQWIHAQWIHAQVLPYIYIYIYMKLACRIA